MQVVRVLNGETTREDLHANSANDTATGRQVVSAAKKRKNSVRERNKPKDRKGGGDSSVENRAGARIEDWHLT